MTLCLIKYMYIFPKESKVSLETHLIFLKNIYLILVTQKLLVYLLDNIDPPIKTKMCENFIQNSKIRYALIRAL